MIDDVFIPFIVFNIYHIVHLDFALLECLKLGFEIGHRVARFAPNITDHYTTDPPILLNLEKGQAPGSRDI